jgi:Acetyltransferase (GNAT) family
MACSWMGETDVRDTAGVRVRPLVEEDLDEADRIFRVAFGTFLGMPEPDKFSGDADSIRTRWKAYPAGALAAELDGRLVGSNFAANWGSVGFFGPLTIAPQYWDRAIAQRLLDATMELFSAWNTRHAGLFTFAQSASSSVPSGRVPARNARSACSSTHATGWPPTAARRSWSLGRTPAVTARGGR